MCHIIRAVWVSAEVGSHVTSKAQSPVDTKKQVCESVYSEQVCSQVKSLDFLTLYLINKIRLNLFL